VRNTYLWTAISWTLLITVACLVSNDSFSDIDKVKIPNKDKVLHFIFYFIFTVLWYLGFNRMKTFKPRKARILAFSLAVSYGILMEVCQGLFTKERTPDVLDAIANTAGGATALLALWIYHKRKTIKKQSPAY
jgi:VanZ family protein